MKCPNCGAEMTKTKVRKPLGNPETWACYAPGCRTGKSRVGFGRKQKQEKRSK